MFKIGTKAPQGSLCRSEVSGTGRVMILGGSQFACSNCSFVMLTSRLLSLNAKYICKTSEQYVCFVAETVMWSRQQIVRTGPSGLTAKFVIIGQDDCVLSFREKSTFDEFILLIMMINSRIKVYLEWEARYSHDALCKAVLTWTQVDSVSNWIWCSASSASRSQETENYAWYCWSNIISLSIQLWARSRLAARMLGAGLSYLAELELSRTEKITCDWQVAAVDAKRVRLRTTGLAD